MCESTARALYALDQMRGTGVYDIPQLRQLLQNCEHDNKGGNE
jgi:hypothetical protein